MRKGKKLIQFVIFLLITVTIFGSLFYVVSASSGFVTQREVEKIWYGYDTDSLASDSDYPFGDTYKTAASSTTKIPSAAIKSVGFDIVYGVRRPLVYYTGEIPYDDAYDEDGQAKQGFNGLPYNTDYKVDKTNVSYWGNSVSSAVTIEDYEKVNTPGNVVSLRLYALQNAVKRGWVFFGEIFYVIVQWFTWLASLLSKLVIVIKNINMTTIMEALRLQELGNVVYDLFIAHTSADGKTRILSPLAIICIIAFLITLVGYVLNYVKGQKKEKNLLTDIIIVALVGIVLVGFGRGNHILTLGNAASDLVNKLVTEFADDTIGNGMWKTSTINYGSYEASDTQNTIANETSLINKSLIDMQIGIQFGVKSIDELSFDQLGDSRGVIANNTLKSYQTEDGYIESTDSVTSSNVFNSNLGYYFWYADSPAQTYRAYHSRIPTSSYYQTEKLSNMITYLQKVYNQANDSQKLKILSIVDHLARPQIGAGVGLMLLLQIVYVLLALCLFRYAIKVVMAKFSMFASIIAIPIGGALIASTKPQMVKTGTGILGIFVMSLIRCLIYGLFFDVILYVVGALLSIELIRMVIVGVLLFIFMKFNKAIDLSIEKALSKVEQQLAPEASQLKAEARAWGRRGLSDLQNWNRNRKGKLVGYDAEGNEIRTKSRSQKWLDSALEVANNELTTNAQSYKSLGKIHREKKKDRLDAKNTTMRQLNDAAETIRERQLTEAENEYNTVMDAVKDEADTNLENMYDAATKTYDTRQMTDDERKQYEEINSLQDAYDTHMNNELYTRLRRKVGFGDELSDKEQALYAHFEQQSKEMSEKLDASRIELNAGVKQRLLDESTQRHKDDIIEKATAVRDAHADIITEGGVRNLDGGNNEVTKENFESLMYYDKVVNNLQDGKAGATARLTKEEYDEARKAYEEYVQENALHGHGKIKRQKQTTKDRTKANQDRTIEHKNELMYGKDKYEEMKRQEEEKKQAQEARRHSSKDPSTRPSQPNDQRPEEHDDREHAEAVLAAGAAVAAANTVRKDRNETVNTGSTVESDESTRPVTVNELSDVENTQASSSSPHQQPIKLNIKPSSDSDSRAVPTKDASDLNGQAVQTGGSAVDEAETKRLREQQAKDAQRNAEMLHQSNDRPTTSAELDDTRTETTKRIESETAARQAKKTTSGNSDRPTSSSNNDTGSHESSKPTVNINLNHQKQQPSSSASKPEAKNTTTMTENAVAAPVVKEQPKQPAKKQSPTKNDSKQETISTAQPAQTASPSATKQKTGGKQLAEEIAKKRAESGESKPKDSGRQKKKPTEAPKSTKKPKKQAGLVNGTELPTGGSALDVEGMTVNDANALFKDVKSGKGAIVEDSTTTKPTSDVDRPSSDTRSTIEDFDSSSFLDDDE